MNLYTYLLRKHNIPHEQYWDLPLEERTELAEEFIRANMTDMRALHSEEIAERLFCLGVAPKCRTEGCWELAEQDGYCLGCNSAALMGPIRLFCSAPDCPYPPEPGDRFCVEHRAQVDRIERAVQWEIAAKEPQGLGWLEAIGRPLLWLIAGLLTAVVISQVGLWQGWWR